jgi:hypothetical protein
VAALFCIVKFDQLSPGNFVGIARAAIEVGVVCRSSELDASVGITVGAYESTIAIRVTPYEVVVGSPVGPSNATPVIGMVKTCIAD